MHSEDAYSISGRSFLVRNWDSSVASFGRNFFGSFHLCRTLGFGSRAPLCVVDLKIGEPPCDLLEMQRSASSRGKLFTDGMRSLLTVGDSYVTVEPGTPSHVTVWFGTSDRARHHVAKLNVLSCAFPAVLRKCGLFEVHAAAVTEPDEGMGFLLVGESNSGKSTLTVRLASTGWKYLSDDMIAIDNCEEGVTAIGLRRIFSVIPSSLDSIAISSLDLALGEPVHSHPLKRRLEPSVAFPSSFVASCTPQVICFIQIGNTKTSRIANVTQACAMGKLIHHCGWSNYDDAGGVQFLRTLGRMVRQSKCIALTAGIDVYEQPALAAKLLRSAAEA